MRVEDLSGGDARVYRAIAELEDAQSAPHLQEVARQAGMTEEETRESLSRLTTDPGLVREVPDTAAPDFGPRYEVVDRA